MRIILFFFVLFSVSSYAEDEPLFIDVNSSESSYKKALQDARTSLGYFKEKSKKHIGDGVFKLVKTYIKNGSSGVYLWLMVDEIQDDFLIVTAFEEHPKIPHIKAGNQYKLDEKEVVDWYINDNGTLYGGYTLRFHRNRMSAKEKLEYDQHVGVSKYAPLP